MRSIDIERKIKSHDSQLAEMGQQKANQSLAIYKNGKKVIVAYKYNKTNDMRIHFNNDNANGTPQLRGNEMFSNSDSIPSINFTTNGNGFNTGKTDFIGPIICQAIANGDTDVNTDGSLHFTGGMHDIADTIGAGKPTAKNLSMKVYIDGKLYEETENITTRCNLVKIIVQNQIMASNTVKLDGNGRCVLNEFVEYTIGTGLKLNVKVTLEALENINIFKYYGMQGNFKGYSDSYQYAQATYICSNGLARYYNVNTNVTPPLNTKINKVVVDDRKNNKAIMTLKNSGLGDFPFNDTAVNPCAFNSQWSKVYFNLIRKDSTPLALNKWGGLLFWEGEYEFLEGKMSIV